MLILLYVSLVIDIIVVAVSFFLLLSSSFLFAVTVLILGLLGIVPLLVIINHIEEIYQLKNDVSKLRQQVKLLTDLSDEVSPKAPTAPPVVNKPSPPKGAWECVKCKTVNKAGALKCTGCNAEFSPSINPVQKSLRKEKISRWVKYK